MNFVMQELHELGYVMYFKHLSFVMIDPQWLADLFKTIVSFNTQHLIKNGMIKRNELIQLMKSNNLTSNKEEEDYFLQLFEKFEICVQQQSSNSNSSSNINNSNPNIIFPSLLPKTKPEHLIEDWERYCNMNDSFGRSFCFPFLPYGAFSRLLASFCRDVSSLGRFWHNGMMLEWKGAYLLVELFSNTNEKEEGKKEKIEFFISFRFFYYFENKNRKKFFKTRK